MEAYMKKRKITVLFLIAGLLFSGCGKSELLMQQIFLCQIENATKRS